MSDFSRSRDAASRFRPAGRPRRGVAATGRNAVVRRYFRDHACMRNLTAHFFVVVSPSFTHPVVGEAERRCLCTSGT